MIVKVQLPLNTSEKEPLALIYSKGRKWLSFPPEADLPEYVVEAVKKTGKAYFEVLVVDGHIGFGEQVAQQNW